MILSGKTIHTPRLSERIFSRDTDAYKQIHHYLYHSDIRVMYDYMESRGGTFSDITPFGAQAIMMKDFLGSVITPQQVDRERKFYKRMFGMDGVYNYDAWMFIAKDLGGRLPLEVWAIPEGHNVPVRTPILTYFNTHDVMDTIVEGQRAVVKNFGPQVAFLPGFIEPKMFKVWSPTTICTYSQHCKKVIYDGLVETGSVENLPYMLWDFGLRGVSSRESAELGGGAHLVNFVGSDTLPAVDFVNEYYSDGQFDEDGDPIYQPAVGVRATEHSVMTLEGRFGEISVVRRILERCPTGIIAMVADSYDLWNFAENIIGGEFREQIINREGTVVVRPDSGEPIPTMLKLLWILGEKFGFTVNDKGYKVLGTGKGLGKIKTLQGEKNTYDAIYEMIRALKGAGWSLDNIACFGMGGALLQGHTRDSQNMAVKLSAYDDLAGNEHEVYKDPITDPGKYSKRGRFVVSEEQNERTGELKAVTRQLKQGEANPANNLLRPIYRNGEMLVHDDFETVRTRANSWMTKS